MLQTSSHTALQALHDSIQLMAAHASNPVLEVLRGISPVEKETKYPRNGLSFEQQGVRGFYHCHDNIHRRADEHGHFHLFLCEDIQAAVPVWRHLAGLSMDGYGQPVDWFTTNRWVTGGQWLTIDTARHMLDQLTVDNSMSLVERWLVAILIVCRQQLQDLLTRRDEFLTTLTSRSNAEAIWQDQRYYELSRSPVDLLAIFQNKINPPRR